MAEQQLEETADFEMSGKELASAIWPSLLADNSFLQALANSQMFCTYLSQSAVWKAVTQGAAAPVVAPTLAFGLTR